MSDSTITDDYEFTEYLRGEHIAILEAEIVRLKHILDNRGYTMEEITGEVVNYEELDVCN